MYYTNVIGLPKNMSSTEILSNFDQTHYSSASTLNSEISGNLNNNKGHQQPCSSSSRPKPERAVSPTDPKARSDKILSSGPTQDADTPSSESKPTPVITWWALAKDIVTNYPITTIAVCCPIAIPAIISGYCVKVGARVAGGVVKNVVEIATEELKVHVGYPGKIHLVTEFSPLYPETARDIDLTTSTHSDNGLDSGNVIVATVPTENNRSLRSLWMSRRKIYTILGLKLCAADLFRSMVKLSLAIALVCIIDPLFALVRRCSRS